MRLLVCGGRNYADIVRITEVLNWLHHELRFNTLINGAARGADRLSSVWARSRREGGIRVIEEVADWVTHPLSAGPIRSQAMLDKWEPDLCCAFPGGRETADMVSRSRRRGLPVLEIPAESGPEDERWREAARELALRAEPG